MIAALMGIALHAAPAAAPAQDWWLVWVGNERPNAVLVFIDKSSINVDGDLRRYVAVASLGLVEQELFEDSGEVNCATRQRRSLSMRLLAPGVEPAVLEGEGPWELAEAGTGFGNQLDFVCAGTLPGAAHIGGVDLGTEIPKLRTLRANGQ